MLTVIFQFVRWVFEKFAVGVLIVGLGVVATGLWLFLKDNVDAISGGRKSCARSTATGRR